MVVPETYVDEQWRVRERNEHTANIVRWTNYIWKRRYTPGATRLELAARMAKRKSNV